MALKVNMLYGRDGLDIDLTGMNIPWTVIGKPQLTLPSITVDDLHTVFRNPIGTPPLKGLIHPDDSLCIVTSDGTRPYVPTRFVLHTLLNHLGTIPPKTVVVTGSGSHTPHTEAELSEIFCQSLLSRLTIVSHDSRGSDLVAVGKLTDGTPVTMNRRYVKADKRIVIGHIEPHFFTGYTGGPKGIAPALCGIETILRLHSYDAIAHPTSTYGDIEGNHSTALIRAAAALAPPDFLINLILDENQQPAAAFAGDYIEAHRAGVAQARKWCEVAVGRRFPIVVVSNAGHPLDQNLYQTVKAMTLGLQLVTPGGTIIVLSECAKGIPSGSPFEKMLFSADSIETLAAHLANNAVRTDDSWQVQKLCQIRSRCTVVLVSSLGEATTRRCHLEYAPSVEIALRETIARVGTSAQVAFLPYGPLVIPRVTEQ
jgi:nickel-dependent lactate racemase